MNLVYLTTSLYTFPGEFQRQHTKILKLRKIRDSAKADDLAVIDYLDTHLKIIDNDVELSWQRFQDVVKYCTEHFVPLKSVRQQWINPWINREIIQTKRKIKRLRKRSKSTTTQFEHLKQDLLIKVKLAGDRFYSTNIEEFLSSDPRKFWLHLSQRKQQIDSIKVNGTEIKDAHSIAEHFNIYFQSVFAEQDQTEFSSTCSPTVDDILITREGVLALLLNINIKKSAGPDNIPNVFLRRYSDQISEFISNFFQLSLNLGEIPADWRIARVVPVHKKGDRAIVSNYRPVSITSASCKLLEHIVAGFIHEFLKDHNILTPLQHGFRKGLSTVTQLVTTVHEFSQVLDLSGQLDVLFLDFSKAFDRVPHGKLLHKLEKIGLPSGIIKWIYAYLIDREQFVDVRNCSCGARPVTSGVPQGGVLGPLLFLIYVNDIIDVIPTNVSIRLYADDSVIFKEIVSHDDHEVLQRCLVVISDWCSKWGMQLNAEKTVLLRVTRKSLRILLSA